MGMEIQKAYLRFSGFTLIELAVAIFIIGLMLGSIITPITSRMAVRQTQTAQQKLSEIKDAILGFAATNGYLPCPDTGNDGQENVSGSSCSATVGSLPYATLGVDAKYDPWGNRFRYAIESNFAKRSPTSLTLSTQANIRVCTSSACSTVLTNNDPSNPGSEAAFVVLSHGPNGYGAIKADTGIANTSPTSADETKNLGATAQFVYRAKTDASAPIGEFDDIVLWASKPQIFKMMVSAGALP